MHSEPGRSGRPLRLPSDMLLITQPDYQVRLIVVGRRVPTPFTPRRVR